MTPQGKQEQKPLRRPPARTPEARESQMVALTMDLVEKRLRNGSASSQETTHFLKIASMKERLERDILEQQKKLMEAKTEAIQSAKRVEELYVNALNAMRSYSGNKRGEDDD